MKLMNKRKGEIETTKDYKLMIDGGMKKSVRAATCARQIILVL